MPGVTSAKVDFEKKTASVTFDTDKANPATLTKATSDAGYPKFRPQPQTQEPERKALDPRLFGTLNSNASRFNGLDFSSEVGPKSFHQLAHPSDEVGSLHGFEQFRGKVVGLKMKDAIPTPAERLDIRRRQERVDPGINQFQMPEALNYDAQARVPIVHEVTAWAGEKFEGGEIRIL